MLCADPSSDTRCRKLLRQTCLYHHRRHDHDHDRKVFLLLTRKPYLSIMSQTPLNVLFLCTHNSARSILSEAALNHLSQRQANGRFKAFSAGSSPRENQQPNPLAIEALTQAGIDTSYLSSKSWDAFAGDDAPKMDLIITVCDNAANEVCPVWPGHPATAHWGYADPSLAEGSHEERLDAFKRTLHMIGQRLELLIQLPKSALRAEVLAHSARDLVGKA